MRVLVTGGSGFIGTNLIGYLNNLGVPVLNLDINPPRNESHRQVWQHMDLRNRDKVIAEVLSFRPSHIVHLAARTDLAATRHISEYDVNINGVANMIEAVYRLTDLELVIFASSMLVCRNGYAPSSDLDYCPNTVYGSSKVEGERLVREIGPIVPWVIVRPTSIWGPWFGEPYRSFFGAVLRGRYVHPGWNSVYKALGFVGNTVHQIVGLLNSRRSDVQGKTFYLCDSPSHTIRDWAETISKSAGRGSIWTFPPATLKMLARCGDIVHTFGYKNPPLTSFRLNNMLTPSGFDMKSLLALIGDAPYSMQQGVEMTLRWIRDCVPELSQFITLNLKQM